MKANIKKTPATIKIVTDRKRQRRKLHRPHMLRAISFHPRERREPIKCGGAFDLGYEFAGGDEVRKSAPISTNRIHKKAPGASRWSEIMKRWNVRVGGWVVAPQQRLRLDEGCGV
jgi:hypothetical protein